MAGELWWQLQECYSNLKKVLTCSGTDSDPDIDYTQQVLKSGQQTFSIPYMAWMMLRLYGYHGRSASCAGQESMFSLLVD
jgi:hypothetical protein